MNTAYITAMKRTPIGKAPRGSLRHIRPDDLAAFAISDLLKDLPTVSPQEIDDIIIGCAMPEAEQGMNIARIAALRAGLPVEVPAVTVNRFCSSGLQTIAMAAERIMCGLADCILAGGAESMSMVPMGGHKFAPNPHLMAHFPETYLNMGLTAERVAQRYEISREAQDRFALRSHHRAIAAITDKKFENEIVAIPIDDKTRFCMDEGPRADTTMEALSKLKPAFQRNGTVSAGNASQMSDGAAVVLVTSESFLKTRQLTPLARFVAFSVRGVAPDVMGIGPVVAIPESLKRANISLNNIDRIELNEAFAAQALAVIKVLDLDDNKVNVNGGAIALGHPLGCTGTYLTIKLINELTRTHSKYGIVTMCIGGGMGASGVFEKV